MQFGLALPMLRHKIESTKLPELAVVAEDSGFSSVWTADHIAVPTENSETYGDVIEQLTTLTWVASKTNKVDVGTSVLVVPLRNPWIVAKQAAALDVLSGGRLILGVGAGWVEGEFEILGADFANRGRILDESIGLMRSIWTQPSIHFDGRFFKAEGVVSFPKPTRQIPIWVGGNSDSAVRRAARLGDGWHPIAVPPSRVKEGAETIRKGNRDVKISMRSMVDITTTEPAKAPTGLVGSRSQILRKLEEYSEAGVEYYLLQSGAESSELVARDIRLFAKEILASF